MNRISWKQQYVVAVTRGSKTKFYYGERLKDVLDLARLKKGDGFAYAKFERGAVQWAEMGRKGALIYYGPMKKKAA